MEGQEFKPFKPEDMLADGLKQSEPQVSLNPAATSGLDVEPTIQWYNKSQQQQTEWWGAKSLWNGFVNLLDGPLGFVRSTMEADIKRQGDKYRANMTRGIANDADSGIAKSRDTLHGLVGVINAIDGAKYDVKVNGFTNKIAAALIENAPQLALQVATHNYAGPMASAGLMFAQIFGNQYNELINNGVSHEDAVKAATTNAFVQSGLEEIGIRGWTMSRTPSALNKLKGAATGFATESLTESMQELPEIVTNLWAEHQELKPADIATMVWNDKGKYLEQMAIAGIVGGIYGGAGGVINATFRDAAVADYQKSRVDKLQEIVKSDIESGANPEYVATAADTISVLAGNDDTAYVDAGPLNAFFQTVSEEEAFNMAMLMGTTVEDVRIAAAEGTEVETTMGGVRGSSVASGGALFEAIKDHLTFDLNSKSISTGEAFQKMLKSAYDLDAKQSQELYDTVDTLSRQMNEAGMSKEVSDSWRTLLISHALTARADNPAQFFKDNPLQVVKGEDGQVGIGFGMTAHNIGLSGAKNVGDLIDRVTSKLNKEKEQPSDFSYISNSGLTYDGSHVLHMSNKHAIHKAELLDIDKYINELYSTFATTKKTSIEGQTVLAKIKGDLHDYGVVLTFGKNGVVRINTAFIDGRTEKSNGEKSPHKNNVNAWIKKEMSAKVLAASSNEALQSVASSGQPISLSSIKDAFGIVNKNVTGLSQDAEQRILGQYQPNLTLDGTGIIRMFDGADASTVIHETGHYFLDAMARDVARGIADEKTAADLEKLLNYAGTNTQDFLAMSIGEVSPYHEKIAEAFESYLLKGEAPSRDLVSVFDRFKKWLLAIYKERPRNKNAIPLTDEVRQVFDSMLACDEALREVEVADGYLAAMYKNGEFEKFAIDQLDEKTKEKLKDQLLKVHEKAVEILAKKANASFSEERKVAIKKYQEDILPAVAQEIRNMPLYKSMAMLREFTEIAVNGKGDKADVRAIARRYLNQEGRAFANWQEELTAVNNELDDMLAPVIEDLKSGMGNGVQIVEVPAEMGGGNVYYRVSNNEEWYQNWYSEYGRRPSASDLRDLVIQNLEGKAGRFTTRSMYGIPDDIATENETRIKELLARQETLEAQKDKATLGRKKGLSITDMTTFDMVAESNGFATGEELANAILNLPTEKQAIDNRIGELTRNEFPNFWEERSTALEAAREALYNDPNAELIALEEQLMVDALNTTLQKQISHAERMRLARAEASAAKAEAKARMTEMTLRKARLPRQFIADERKAAVNAALATSKGDMENALKYKHQQLVAHQMVGLSLGIREAYDMSLRFAKTMAKKRGIPKGSKPSYWYDQNTFLAAAELMTRMGLKVKDYNAELHYGNGDLQNYVNGLREQGWNIFIPDGVLSGALDVSRPGTLTVDEYFGAINALKNFRAVANAINSANKELKAKDWETVKQTIKDNLGKLETVWIPTLSEKNGKLEKVKKYAKRKIASMYSADNLWEMLDDWSYGYFNKTWGAMLKHCGDREAVMINKWDEQVKQTTQAWAKALKEQGIDVDQQVAMSDLGFDKNGAAVVCDRHKLIGMLCYLGSRSGMEKLCGTPIVGVAQSDIWVAPVSNSKIDRMAAIEATRDNLINFLGAHLTKADVIYAQQILDMCNQFWPELQTVNLRTIGFAPDKVEATALAVNTVDGGIVEMRGGYCPLVRNGDAGSHPFSQDRVWGLNTDDAHHGKSIETMNTTTAASMNRTQAAYPVRIDQGWFDIPMRDTIHDICYREAMQEFKKLFNDDEIFSLLLEKMGPDKLRSFREMLQAAAQPYGGASMNLAECVFSDLFNWMRKKTVHAAILGNFKTAAQNLSNMYLFGNAVEGFTYADVTAAIFGHFGLGSFRSGGIKELNDLCSKSVFFNERAKFLDFSIRDIVQKSKMSKIETETMRWGTAVLVATDNLTAKPIWAMAYTKKIREGATEQDAIDFADTIIRRTLGSSRIQDVSSMQRGGPFLRLFTTFQSFFNTQYNQWAREYNIAEKMIDEKQYKDAAFRITSFVAAKYLFVGLVSTVAALKNPFGNDDDDDDKMSNLSKELMLYPMSMLGPYGQIANVCIQKLAGLRSYGYKMTAAQSAVDKVTNFFAAAGRALSGDMDSWQDLAEPTVGAVTFYYGVPDQINKLFWNAWDIMMNDMDPEWQDIMRRRPKRDR